jgi:hypothetical protein
VVGVKEVLSRLREARPGSVETDEQEAFLADYHRQRAAEVYAALGEYGFPHLMQGCKGIESQSGNRSEIPPPP